VLLVSTLLLPSALRVKDLRRRLDELHAPTRLIVGGAPFRLDPQLWREVGADANGNSATDAIALVTHALELAQ
jgi:methanogenic corrinoid protein MtbC1